MFGRHLNWFTQSPGGKLWHPDDDGGGGDWPSYEIPPGVGGEGNDPPAPGAPPAGQPAAPAAQPTAGANGNPGDGAPGARQPGQQQPPAGQPGQQPGARRTDLPDYRQRQIAERDQRAEADRINTLVQQGIRDQLSRAFGIGQPSGQPADPRSERLRETIFQLMPELKPILEKQKELLAAAESGAQWAEGNKSYWQGVAARTMAGVHDGVAETLLGTGKTGKDLDPEAREDVQHLFIRWVESDKTLARVQRYEAQDATLVREFLTGWKARYIDPVRRSASVVAGNRGQQRAQVPTNGPGAMPPAATPPKQNNQDEDEVHGRGWAVASNLMASGR